MPLTEPPVNFTCLCAAKRGFPGNPKQSEVSARSEDPAVSAGGALRSCICSCPGGRSWMEACLQRGYTAM